MEASAPPRTARTARADAAWLRSLPSRIGLAASAAWAAISGLLPHVLHHAGPLAGAAVFAGTGGSLLFGALGLVIAIPFLRRMYLRFGTWQAPALALALFAAVFSFSTFVIGPRISGEDDSTQAGERAPGAQDPASAGHEAHHD